MEPNRPVLLLMAGLPGSGKTTLALAVGRRLGWPVIDKDTVKSGLLDLGADEEIAAQASYVLLHELAHDIVVGQGLSLILDTPSSYERVLEVTKQIVQEANGALCVVLCEADRKTRAKRLAQRERRSSHVIAIDEEAEAAVERRFQQLPEHAVRVSTEASTEDLVDGIVAYVMRAGK